MRQDLELTSFTKGELSPRLRGRTDYEGYFNGCETLLNMVVLLQGGATRRPGTVFSDTTKFQTDDAAGMVRLIAFQFSVTQAYMLVFGNGYMRVFRNGFPIDNGSGGTVEIGTPWNGTEVFELGHAQSADVLYITHPNHMPQVITRTSHTTWTIAPFGAFDGPYMDTVTGQGNLTLSATSGAVVMTWSTTNGLNRGAGLSAADVGRYVRFSGNTGAVWCWIQIQSVISAVSANGIVLPAVINGATNPADSLGPSGGFQMGAWYTGNYPWLVSFWQQRLFFAATNLQPSRIDGSQVNDFTNFAPSKADGSVLDNNAVSWIIVDDQVNAARWLVAAGSSRAPQLAIGNDGAEQVVQAGGSAQALTPTSVQAFRETNIGGRAHSSALHVNKAVIFASYGGRKLYEWAFNWQSDGYIGADKSVESEHLTRSGLIDIAYQKRPFSVIWGIRADGNLVGLTYLPEQAVQGWHQHRLGGNYYGGHPIVESMACIPAQDNTYDELWLVVKRTVNGAVVRTVEVMAAYFDAGRQGDAVYMDLAVKSDHTFPLGTLTASAMTRSTSAAVVPITFTVSGATPFNAGNLDSVIHYNGGTAIVTGFVSSTVLTGIWYIGPTSRKPAPTGSWSLTPQNDTYSGLDHLEGEDVLIYGDGADFGVETVSGGTVTIDSSRGQASSATIGLPIPWRLVSMPWAPKQAADSQGHYKTIAAIWLRLYDSLGCRFGRQITDEYTGQQTDELDSLPTRNTLDLMGVPPPLQSGIYRLPMPGGHDQEGQIVIEGEGPYPTTVLAVLATADVGELPGGG
jgi:hypothetical protein